MSRLQLAIDQITFARNYPVRLLDQTPVAKWFRQPPGGVRESVPDADPKKCPDQAEIRAVLDRVHDQALRELRGLDESGLERPVLKPHSLAKTKLWSLLW